MLPEVDILLRAAFQCEVSLAVRNRALALFHHFNLLCSENAKEQHDMVMLTAAALKCAARYEEEDLDYDSIILIYYCLVNKTLKVPSAIFPEYMAIKSSLMTVDHIFCRMLSFDFSHRLAHEFLLPFLTFILERHPRLSKFHEKVSVTSVRFANDAYTHPLSITFKPDHLAVACIHAALHVYGLLNKLLLVEPWYQGLAKDMTVGKLREIKIFLFNLNEDESGEEDWVPEEDKILEENSNQPTNPTDINTNEDTKGYEAILNLHRYLDDDEDGNIDIDESNEFYREELNYKSGYDRQKRFHRNDKHISVDELWLSWKSSEVHNWTVEETIQWLISYVNLPQYADKFKENSIDGSCLPRLAVSSNFLLKLGIKDPIHKHKINLKAMDVVLFGPPRYRSYVKDITLALSVCVATGGCWFAYVQHKKSQSHLRRTMKDMESLHRAEESLRDLQKALDQAKLEQEIVVTEKKNLERRLQDEKISAKFKHEDSFASSDGDQTKIQRLEEELKEVIEDFRSAERALKAKNWIPSPKLQLWLQLTHELELQNYNEKKAAAEKQLLAAKEGCDKLRKKRTSFMGAFRVAHGNAIDDVDNRILKARSALSEVTKDLQERLSRWKEIEALCGFPVVHNPGIRQIETMLGSSVAGTPTTVTPRVPRRSSEGLLTDEDSVSGKDSNISAIQHLVHNSATLFLAPLPSSNFNNIPSFDNVPPRSSLYQDDSFSIYTPGFISFPQNDQTIQNGSIASIPGLCNQRSGFHFNIGSGRSIQLADLKSVASSSAILQRSNAYYLDGYENISEEKIDKASLRENVSATKAMPMFTVGESQEMQLENTYLQSLDSRQESPDTY